MSYNKLIAKLASDQNKPDGICVVRPAEGAAFIAAMPVRRIHGVGPVTARRMQALGIETGADLRARDLPIRTASLLCVARHSAEARRVGNSGAGPHRGGGGG